MNYTLLRFGDHLPTVGVLQKLLNRFGEDLDPDGVFGRKTLAAVQKFQRSKHLLPDGIVGVETWPKLTEGVDLPIVDSVDVFDSFQIEEAGRIIEEDTDKLKDPKISKEETRKLQQQIKDAKEFLKEHKYGQLEVAVASIRAVGGNPLVLGGMSNGVAQAVSLIRSAARNVFLLRFHGHASSGSQNITAGTEWSSELNALDADTIPVLSRVISSLRAVFGPYGSVEFKGCQLARGPEGRHMLTRIASILGVPATAGEITQHSGGTETFHFRRPTYTAVPYGQSLEDWCRALPDFPALPASRRPFVFR
jgi:hypothetical protein